MRTAAELAVPEGYVVHRVADTWLVLDRNHVGPLVELRLADVAFRRTHFSRAPRRGRGASPLLALGDGTSVVLRRYRHGGLFGRLTGPVLIGSGRALEEFHVTARAEAANAPVPHVLCLVLWPMWGPFWSAIIGTREESEAIELLEAWKERPAGPERWRLLRRTGEAIRRLHDAGVDHPDLQLRNLLICPSPSGPAERILVIDLDRSRFHGRTPPSARTRAANLARLVRSAVKEGLLDPRPPCREVAAILGGYTRGDRELRRALLRWAPLEAARLALHRLGYRLRRTG